MVLRVDMEEVIYNEFKKELFYNDIAYKLGM